MANAPPTWEVVGVSVTLAVTDPQATPHCVASPDDELSAVLGAEWDHEVVLAGLPNQGYRREPPHSAPRPHTTTKRRKCAGRRKG